MPLHHCTHHHIEQKFFFRTVTAENNRSHTAKTVQGLLRGVFNRVIRAVGCILRIFCYRTTIWRMRMGMFVGLEIWGF